MRSQLLLVMGLLALVASPLAAGEIIVLPIADYTLRVSEGAAGDPGDEATVSCLLDNNNGNIQGWSFGLCHDFVGLDAVDAVQGATTTTVLNGGPPDFATINFEDGGVTMGVVISFMGLATLPEGSGYDVLDVTYDLFGEPGEYLVGFCDVLGMPPVVTVVVVDGASIPPAVELGVVTILEPNRFSIGHATGVVGQPVDVDVLLDNISPVNAAQVSMAYDPSTLSFLGAAQSGAAAGAEFFEVQAGAEGEIVYGLLMDLNPPIDGLQTIPVGAGQVISTLSFIVSEEAESPGSTDLEFVDGLGNPPLNNVIVIDGGVVIPAGHVDGSVDIFAFNSFIRSDCNGDTVIDIADGIFLIAFLFGEGASPNCGDACDSNDDADLDVSDAIYIWNYLLLDGPVPIAPFPAAGLDPTPFDGLGCNDDGDAE